MDPRLIVIRGNSGSGKTSIVEGIRAAHGRGGHFYYLDIPFEETVRRHAIRDKVTAFTAEDMADWYRPRDLLERPRETVIGESSSLDATVQQILQETGLGPALGAPAAEVEVGDDNRLAGGE